MAAAKKSPQAAFFALTKSLQCEWSYLQRVFHLSELDFQALRDAICKQFVPALFQGNISNDEEEFFFLPVRLAGLGLRDPTKTATTAYHASKQGTQVVQESVKGLTEFSVLEHLSKLKHTVSLTHKTQNAADLAKFNTLISRFSPERQRALKRATSGTSSWLTSTPLERFHFDLSPYEFKDGLAIRYLRHPADLPACCDGCGAEFTLQHGLDCKKGGLVIQRHNEVRDCLGDIASEVWPSVIKEPIVREADHSSNDVGLRLDLGVRGVWSSQTEALFDIRIIDTDAPSYKHRTPEAVLESAAKEKKRIYQKAVEDRRGQFTPFVVSVDGLMHREAKHLMKRIAASLAKKWEKSYSDTVSFVRMRLSFAILRSASLCLRGSRVKWRCGLGFEDGAGLPAH